MMNTLTSPARFHTEIRQYGEASVHLLFWLFFFAERWMNNWGHLPLGGKLMYSLSWLCLPLMFYLNAFWLIPAYLRRGKVIHYCVAAVAIILLLEASVTLFLLASMYLRNLEFAYATEFQKWFLRNFPLSGPMLGLLLSFAYRFTRDWIYSERIKEQLKAEKSAAELAYLKSQVDPHFLFNTLNNLYALALEEYGHRTAEGIARLGSLMRYSLHDSQADFILLNREIEYIERYIELQRLRIPENQQADIKLLITGDYHSEKIAPMLLLPFIENAFKYGISRAQPLSIRVEIALKNNVLYFKVSNSINTAMTQSKNSGLGIANVQKRLQLQYKGKHSLSCSQEENTYLVKLQLNLGA